MPPKPIAPASSVSHTCGSRNARSSRRPVASGSPGNEGTNASTSTAVRSARPVTAQNAARQPDCCPSHVAAGTPITFATDSPSITIATARPLRPSGASEAATSEATPKYAPCGKPVAIRARTSIPYDVASALTALPAAYATISATRRPRRGRLAPRKARTGAPITTPTAYAEMMWPAVGIETPTPSAICGNSPMTTNSVVPMAKPPIASASTARVKWRVVTDAWGGAGAVVVIAGTASRRRGLFRALAHVGLVGCRAQPSEASASLKVAEGRITAEAFAASGR